MNSKCIHENITVSVPKSVTSESEGETMHGGADPENVAGGAPKGSTLAQSKVPPAEPQDGSIMGLIQGKSDIDLNGVLLNEDQVCFIIGATLRVKTDQLGFQKIHTSLEQNFLIKSSIIVLRWERRGVVVECRTTN